MTVLTTWHNHHGWFLLWPLVPLFWITTVFLLVRFVFWRRGPWSGRRGPDPRAILAERYARGEITHDEYRERLGHLEGA
jgi:putative membrane protein